MNVGMGNKAALFLFWEYLNGIFSTVGDRTDFYNFLPAIFFFVTLHR
jgi:hypothetical protein